MLSTLTHRDRQPELMDQPGIDEDAHRRALDGIRRVNLLCSAVPLMFRSLRQLAQNGSHERPLRVLDVGSGGGDVAIRLARRAERAGLPIEMHGCDLSPTAVEMASERATTAGVGGVHFFQHDAIASPLPAGYDVTMCSLFLHHFDNEQAVHLLRRLAAGAGRAVLVDDLLRTKLGYALCWVGCRIISRSPMVHVDGPLSVRAAFRVDEAKKLADDAGLQGATFRRHWPQRFLMTWIR
jgi:2-polyprenyl-3-methyl-5-hydroxy-6-metoxy-1,4-benzoquinol methylase